MSTKTRLPILLYSYLATEMLAPFFASFVIMNCIFFLVKLIPFLDIILELDIGIADFIRSFSYLLPNMLLYSIPMASMMGVIIGFTRLCNDSEILALKACGLSIYTLLPPVILVSLIISIITAYFSTTLIPAGEIAAKQLMSQLTKELLDKGIQQKQFTTGLSDLVVYVEEVDKKTNHWKDVWVSDMRGQKTPVIIMAQTGWMKTNLETMLVTIILNKGSLHRSDSKQSQIVTFDNYTLNMPLTPPATKNTTIGIAGMTMKQLTEKAALHGEESETGRKNLIHFHKRLVLPVGCLIMSLMALPLGLQSGPGRRASGIPLGLGFFIIYYVFFTLGKNLAENTGIPVGVAMWSPNFFFALLTLGAVVRVANEKSLMPEKLSEKLLVIRQNLASKKGKRRQREEMKKFVADVKDYNLETKQNSYKVTCNARSKVFHLPDCEFYKCQNCTIEYDSIELAKEAGYEPCRFCRDLLLQNVAHQDGN